VRFNLNFLVEWELSRPNELFGSTHQSRACINGANHFGHSFTLDISKNIQSDIPHPLLLVKVFNVGWWNRQQALGYGFAHFPTTAGSTSVTIATWKPESSSINQELEQLFLNLSPQLENLSYVGIAKNVRGLIVKF
jgi:Ciliary basal body-associated, B9 protein